MSIGIGIGKSGPNAPESGRTSPPDSNISEIVMASWAPLGQKSGAAMSSGLWSDVQIQPEEICRVVLRLQGREPLVVGGPDRGAHEVLTFLGEPGEIQVEPTTRI